MRNSKHLPWLLVGPLAVLLLSGYTIQGIRSSYIPSRNQLGNLVSSFDVTPRLVGTRNLLLHGINPYSVEGQAAIDEIYFGQPVANDPRVSDKQRFVYPIYVVFLYAPFVFLRYADANLALFMISLILLLITILLWYKMIFRKPFGISAVAVTCFFLTWWAGYSIVWQRQPAMLVFFFLTLGSYLLSSQRRAFTDILAGTLLFFSTIKPQSSLLVLLFLVSWVLVTFPRRRIAVFVAGFLGTALVSTIGGLLLVPTWVTDFLAGIPAYQGYAGKTGAQAVFGGATVASHISSNARLLALLTSAVCIMLGFVLAIRALRQRCIFSYILTISYLMVLQAYVFQCIHFVTIMAIPAVLILLSELESGGRKRTRYAILLWSLVLLIAVGQWIGFLNLLGSRIQLALELRALIPLRFYDVVLINMFPPLVVFFLKTRLAGRESLRSG